MSRVNQHSKGKNLWLPIVGISALLVSLTAIGLSQLTKSAPPTKKMVQQISLIQPPPPPPPPPEMEQPEIEEEIPVEEAEPEVEELSEEILEDNLPPADSLGLDAEGAAGMDGFGLAARKGGRDFLAGSGRSRFGWYASVLEQDIQNMLYELEGLRDNQYSVNLQIWITQDGKIKEVKLLSTTGDRKLDSTLRGALAGISAISEPPPKDMPQPIRLKITSTI
ncbi:MAG TPA: TonB-dependent receptor [Gammaproteobacteria bacterium]|nr:TonB-dependent receptor [Gammaproteobacteria bacterium]